ncbi:putative ribonuclease H-like domain-containing protein, partial [Tanacetum coccineum]
MLVQVYVDDIIFGYTRKSWCDEFEALMKGIFQMSSMGELIFFLGLQVKQKTDGIFISQDKYVSDILKRFDLASVKTAITPMETKMALTKDKEAADVDVTPKTLHLNAVKRIFNDYAGANLDRKSTTGGCQFLGSRLISWQCKKQTIVATSTTNHSGYLRHHFIRDSYEKKLIRVEKIHTDFNVADLLTKAFDGP